VQNIFSSVLLLEASDHKQHWNINSVILNKKDNQEQSQEKQDCQRQSRTAHREAAYISDSKNNNWKETRETMANMEKYSYLMGVRGETGCVIILANPNPNS